MKKLILFLVFLIGLLSISLKAQPARMPIGMNLPGNNYWSTSLIFNDAMKTASDWLTYNATGDSPWNTDLVGQINFDENGFPLVVPHPVAGHPAQALRFLINNYYTGTFVVLFDGDGTLTFNGGHSYTQNGRLYIELTGEGGHRWFHLTRSQQGNHVRNIRIIPVEFENNESAMPTFYELFLEGLRPFHALRFMDWINTNNSRQEFWENRVTPSFYTQGGRDGISFDYAIELANLLDMDAWFCIPHRADDNYIRELARLVRDNLNPHLTIYLEYSNEIWNWLFSQAIFVNENAPGHANAYVSEGLAAIRATPGDHPYKGAFMKARLFRLWREEFGQSEFDRRVLRVAAGQAGWFDTFRRLVEYLFNTIGEGADVLSPTAYFNFTTADHNRWNAMDPSLVTPDMIIDAVARDWPAWELNKRELGALATRFGMSLAVYEGGQHMQPYLQGEFGYNQAVWDAQIHPRMYDLYMENFRIMALPEVNTTLYVAFSYVSARESRWGSWGHLEYLEQLNAPNLREIAPKYQALLDANTPREQVTSVKNTKRTSIINAKILAYPNPAIAGSNLSVHAEEIENREVKVTVISTAGRVVQQKLVQAIDGNIFVELPKNLAGGMYFVSIDGGDNAIYKTQISITDTN